MNELYGGTMKKQTSTGKFIIIALLILTVSAFALYRYLDRSDKTVYEGTIISISINNGIASMLVDGRFIHSENTGANTVTSFMLNQDTKIGQRKGCFNDLSIGNHIRIAGPDSIRTSYPAQADADTIEILSEDSPYFMISGEVLEVKSGSGTTILTFLVRGNVTGYGENTEVYVSIPRDSYYPFGNQERSGMIIPGDEVFVLIRGAMAKSYPMQAISSSVVITKIRAND